MEWISIKDRLPEPNIGVLITDGHIIAVAEFRIPGYHDQFDLCCHGWEGYEWEFEFASNRITHWMPLPEFPDAD